MDQSVIREALAAIRKELRSRMGKHLGLKDEPKADDAPADESEPKQKGVVEIILGGKEDPGEAKEDPAEEAAESPAEEAAEDAAEPEAGKDEAALAALEALLKAKK